MFYHQISYIPEAFLLYSCTWYRLVNPGWVAGEALLLSIIDLVRGGVVHDGQKNLS